MKSLYNTVAFAADVPGSGSAQPSTPSTPAPKPAEPAAKSTTTPTATSPAPAVAKSNVEPLHKPKTAPAKGKVEAKPAKGKAPEKKTRGNAENAKLREKVWGRFKGGATQTVQQLSKDLGAPEKKIRSAIDGLRSMVGRPDGQVWGVKDIHNVGRNMFSIDRKAGKKSA